MECTYVTRSHKGEKLTFSNFSTCSKVCIFSIGNKTIFVLLSQSQNFCVFAPFGKHKVWVYAVLQILNKFLLHCQQIHRHRLLYFLLKYNCIHVISQQGLVSNKALSWMKGCSSVVERRSPVLFPGRVGRDLSETLVSSCLLRVPNKIVTFPSLAETLKKKTKT